MNAVPGVAESNPRRILAIGGSLRRDSFNRRLLHAAALLAPPGLEVEIDESLGRLPPFDEDIEAAAGEAGPVRALRESVAAADALLIATPEYNHSIPGVLKNAIDWLSRPSSQGEVLVGKPVAAIGASGGRWGTRLAQAALRQVLFATESSVLAAPAIYLAEAGEAFDAAGALIDLRTRALLLEVLAFLERHVPARAPGTHRDAAY